MKKLFKHLIPGFAVIFLMAFAACTGGGGEVGSSGDATAPVISGNIIFSDIKADSVIVRWPAAVDNDTAETSLSYKLVIAANAEAIDTISEVAAITGDSLLLDWDYNTLGYYVSGLQGLTEYYFSVLVKDWSGNISIYTPQKVKTLDGIAPTTMGSVTFSNITTNSVQVSWNAATDNSFEQSGLSYRLVSASTAAAIDTIAEASSSASGITVVMNWTVNTLTCASSSLSEGNTYYYTVLVRDGDGNMAIYSPQSVTTLDVTSPEAGSQITFTNEAANSVTVNWGAGTDNGTSQTGLRYKVVCASTPGEIDTIAEVDAITDAGLVMDWTVNTLSCSATGLSHGTFYYFAVLVEDGSGNMAIYSPMSYTTIVAQWARSGIFTGSDTYSDYHSVCSDNEGNVYAAGTIYGGTTVDFGNNVNVTVNVQNKNNFILVKFNSSGIAQWAKTVSSGSDTSYFKSICVDTNGNIFAAGYIYGTGLFNLGDGVSVAGTSSGSNILLVKYSTSGLTQWAITVTSGTGSSDFSSIKLDANGNIYAAGTIKGTGVLNFGNTITARGVYSSGHSVLLVKYNSTGVAQFARSLTSGSKGSGYSSVAIDNSGNIYAAGGIGTSTYDFGNSVTATGTSSSDESIVVVKYNSSGTAEWARTVMAGTQGSGIYSLAVDANSNVYAAGYIYNTMTYGFGNNVYATGTYTGLNVLLVKYNSSGTAQWARTVTSISEGSLYKGVCVDSVGNIYTSGSMRADQCFGNNVTALSPGDHSTVIVKYNTSGDALWAKSVMRSTGSPANTGFESLCLNNNGSVFAVGNIGKGQYDFGNNSVISNNNISMNLVLVKYQ